MGYIIKPFLCFIFVLLCMMGVATSHAHAYNKLDKWRVRGQIMAVFPAATMDLQIEDIEIGAFDVEADNTTGGEFDVSYFIFDYLAIEGSIGMISAYKTSTIDENGQFDDEEDDPKLFLIPASLNLQFHFAPYGKLTPYVGSGVTYTIGREGGTFSKKVGYNIQVGFDYWYNKKTALSLELKKFYKLSADLKPLTIQGFTIRRTAHVDPLMVNFGMAWRF